MDLPSFVAGISFRLNSRKERGAGPLRPEAPRSSVAWIAAAWLLRTGVPTDRLNTRLPCENGPLRARLRDARLPGRKTPFAVAAIINRGVARMPAGEACLVLGVADGSRVLAAISGNTDKPCVAVGEFERTLRPHRVGFLQRFERLSGSRHVVHEQTSRGDSRKLVDRPIGFCVVDSDAPDTRERLSECEPLLAENAIVLVGGANDAAVRAACLDWIHTSSNQFRVLADCAPGRYDPLTFGDGILLVQLLGRNRASADPLEMPTLVPAA